MLTLAPSTSRPVRGLGGRSHIILAPPAGLPRTITEQVSTSTGTCTYTSTSFSSLISVNSRLPRGHGALPRRVCRPNASSTANHHVKDTTLSISLDTEYLYKHDIESPHGTVEDVMRKASDGLLTCMPGETLDDIIPKLKTVTGLPVVGPDGRVTGVISRKDIIRVRQSGGSLSQKVKEQMTSPAISVKGTATVEHAANLMLKHKFRMLPVVDKAGKPIGIVSRSHIFKPLFQEAYQAYMCMEEEVMSGRLKTAPNWSIKYLYDGSCSMCLSLVAVLKRNDKKHRIHYVNIADPNYNATDNMGVKYEDAMKAIHAIHADGTIVIGTEAIRALFDTVGLGWATRLSELPLITKLVDVTYDFLSRNRISLGNTFDAVIASKRMEMSKKGEETCANDVGDGCKAEW